MTHKTLFVWYDPFQGIANGGAQANERCLRLAEKVLGNDSIDSFFVNQNRYQDNLGLRVLGTCMSYMGYFNGLTPKALRKIVEVARDYDCVFLSSSLMGVVAKALRKEGYKGRIVVHFHNIEIDYFETITPKWLPYRKSKLRAVSHNEQLSCCHADAVAVLNNRDAKRLYELYGRKADAILPITLPDTFVPKASPPLTSDIPQCLFVGSNFPANVEGILWFVREVLSHVNIHLTIVGRGMETLKGKLPECDKITLAGAVDSLDSYYQKADFVVMPIFCGAGMKVKTCEALMYGKNILATDEALEGYDVEEGRIGARCNDTQSFIHAVQYYASHPVPRLNAYSRQVYEKNHRHEAVQQQFELLFGNVIL